MSNFDEIRPYNDREVPEILEKLQNDPELLRTVAHFKFNRWPKFLRHSVGTMLVKKGLASQLKTIHDVKSFQMMVKGFMDQMITQTITELSVSGIENIPDDACLFVSNHRDIAMDPALVNWALHKNGKETVRIAIGDNLLTKPWTSDVMRLNKSFIVRRSITAPRQLFAAFKTLSSYIQHSLKNDGEHVWIAQRQGRAKDGIDKTDPAIIKMFAMAKAKDQTLAEYINTLNLIPVSISYEYDPCDAAKARELTELATSGEYKKGPNEDIQTIGQGITGFKGRVSVHFDKPIKNLPKDASAEGIARFIDDKILTNYVIRPSNIIAFQHLQPDEDVDTQALGVQYGEISKESARFEARFNDIEPSDETAFLAAYAAPVTRRMEKRDSE